MDGFSAKMKGDRRLARSERGCPSVDISQLEIGLISVVATGSTTRFEPRRQHTRGYRRPWVRYCETPDYQSCSRHESGSPGPLAAWRDL